ncbi:MAG: glycogen debranching protein [Candidatus Marinimicrobia bacterium]|nr:glycogen debranching protein [Candidatus Neomarinimicrobiota bacterium]
MRKYFFLSILVFGLTACNSSQELYKNSIYTIYKDKVVQGNHCAQVISEVKMESNFQSDYKVPTKKVLDFKFALNGTDNERHPGEDHHLVLSSIQGKQISPVYTFGEPDPQETQYDELLRNDFLDRDIELTLRCDMRKVMAEFEQNGYFVLYNGEKFYAKDFKGVFVAGSTLPLSWDFGNLPNRPEFKLEDTDHDGIFEVTINIDKFQMEKPARHSDSWELKKNISGLPQFQSDIPLLNALYNLSLEEMLLDIREDQTFMAGAKWPGVWTRDISYAIILSLAAIQPEISKNSLMKKVDGKRIIQDTGTGGSWPVSSDRMIWSVAAWEVYKATGDREWLRTAYEIMKHSADTDLMIVYDKNYNLFRGESSFLDWREQTYPRWMEPKDIYRSLNLGTNALFYETFRILGEMAEILDEDGRKYQEIATNVKAAINAHFWLTEKGYYGQYLYGRDALNLSPKSETLGEALCILFDIADEDQKQSILRNMPVVNFGPTCIFPQIPGIPPYHNDGIWPFVVAYWTLAAKNNNHPTALAHGLGSIYRAAALYLTNYENMVAQTGDFMGTEINSPRQLWSVAGNLAMIYKVFLGMEYHPDKLVFKPLIPKNYAGQYQLSNFPYCNSTLEIHLTGFGDQVAEFKIDEKTLPTAEIPCNLSGNHKIEIVMNDQISNTGDINLVQNRFSPETPILNYSNGQLVWTKIDQAIGYLIIKDGKYLTQTMENQYNIDDEEHFSEYQVVAVNQNFDESFYSNPVIVSQGAIQIKVNDLLLDFTQSHVERISFEVDKAAQYYLLFDYSNGAGPVNTSNKCAIRKIQVNNEEAGPLILPQRGADNWSETGQTLPVKVTLKNGKNEIIFIYDEDCENMNKTENKAIIRGINLFLTE